MNDEPYITLSDIKILVNHPPRQVELIIRSSQFVDQLREPLHKGRSIGGSGNPVGKPPSVYLQTNGSGWIAHFTVQASYSCGNA
jgi:hypothetical protein